MDKKIIIITAVIVAVILAGGGAFYYFKIWQNKNKNDNAVVVEKASDFPKNLENDTNEKIIFFRRTDNGNEILQYDLGQKEERLIFTDRDEQLKINFVGNIALLKNEVIVYFGSDSSGKIAVVNLKDSAKTIINESFTKPQTLAQSSDGQTVVYSQTNPETNQSTIFQMARDGSNKRLLWESEKSITYLAINQNGDKIAYTTDSKDHHSTIEILDANTLKNNQIYASDNQILSLQYHPDNQIIFTEGLNNQIQTGKVMVTLDGGSLRKIFETKKDFPWAAKVSNDFLDTAFILVEYKDKFDQALSGEADFIKVGEESINKVGSGNLIIGWQL